MPASVASALKTSALVTGLLVCGSLNTITLKISFTMQGTDLEGREENFKKPWFVTFIMFVAMSLSLLFDRSFWRRRGKLQAPLIDDASGNGGAAPAGMAYGKKVRMVSIPAVFDILATGLCSMGFLYIPASVWQLLRGAEMVFAALFAVLFLGRRLRAYHWIGVACCVLGIVLVGLASVWGEPTVPAGGAKGAKNTGLVLLGMSLALGGQVVQAAQVVAEEWLLRDVDLPGLQIVGFEGLWGGLIMLVAVFPLLYYLPGTDHGHLENELNAFAMLISSQPLYTLITIYTFSCLTYNMCGIGVTEVLSSVHRVMLEAFRTSLVWIFGLTVHYCVDPQSPFGEAWTPYSWLEVVGFFVLMFGQAIYGGIIKIQSPDAYISVNNEVAFPSPGAGRTLVSPLPAH